MDEVRSQLFQSIIQKASWTLQTNENRRRSTCYYHGYDPCHGFRDDYDRFYNLFVNVMENSVTLYLRYIGRHRWRRLKKLKRTACYCQELDCPQQREWKRTLWSSRESTSVCCELDEDLRFGINAPMKKSFTSKGTTLIARCWWGRRGRLDPCSHIILPKIVRLRPQR